MNDNLKVLFGFLGGTIVAVEGGYKVLQHHSPDKIYQRLSDAKWFLALRWCDRCDTPAAILNNTGQLSFYNQPALQIGENIFIPIEYRQAIFNKCLEIKPGETVNYSITGEDSIRVMEIQSVEIDPRYGKVALVRATSFICSSV